MKRKPFFYRDPAIFPNAVPIDSPDIQDEMKSETVVETEDTPAKEDKKDPEEKVEPSLDDKKDPAEDTDETPGFGDKADEKKPADKKDAKKVDDKPGEDVGEGDALKPLDAQPTEEEVATFTGLAEVLGMKVDKDDFESFKAAVVSDKEKAVTEAVEKAKAEFTELDISKYNPKAQRLIEFLNSDEKADLEDFINPGKPFDQLLFMNDEDIVKEKLSYLGWDQEKIDKKVAELVEDGKLDTEAYALRVEVQKNKEVRVNQVLQERITAGQQAVALKVEKEKALTQEIHKTIDNVSTFMGKKVGSDVRDELKKVVDSGVYRKRLQEDPKLMLNAILFDRYGAKMLESAKTDFQKEGVNKIQDKLSNTKAIGGQSGGVKDQNSAGRNKDVDQENPFAAWADIGKDGND